VRRFTVTLYVLVMSLALPAAAWAASPSTSTGTDAPTGHDWTLTSVFIVAAGIPTLLAVLTLIDVARGKHSQHHADH
jgi:hypothetical protein